MDREVEGEEDAVVEREEDEDEGDEEMGSVYTRTFAMTIA